jgi:hypothetical protein
MVTSHRVNKSAHHQHDGVEDDVVAADYLGESDVTREATHHASSSALRGGQIGTGVASAEGSGVMMMANRLDPVPSSRELEQSSLFSISTFSAAAENSASAASDLPQRMDLEKHPTLTMAMVYAPNAYSFSGEIDDAASSHLRAAFAPPIVTKTTRRETFAASNTSFASTTTTVSTTAKQQRKQSKKSIGSVSGSGGSRTLVPPSQNLSSSSSSGDEENASMMDLFSPPPPSILRTRPRGGGNNLPLPSSDCTTLATIATATTFDISVEGNAVEEEQVPESHHQQRYHQRMDSASSSSSTSSSRQHLAKYSGSSSPPTIFTPHANTTEGGRMAMSTSQKHRQHHGQLVHVPKSREGEAEFHAQEDLVEDAEGRGKSVVVGSAPAKFHVSGSFEPLLVSDHYFLIEQIFSLGAS